MNSFYWMVFGIGLGTYCIRISFLLFSSKVKMSDRRKQILSFIPVAVLSALIAPMAFFHQGRVDFLMGYEQMFILALASLLSFYVKNIFVTVNFGLLMLYLINLL